MRSHLFGQTQLGANSANGCTRSPETTLRNDEHEGPHPWERRSVLQEEVIVVVIRTRILLTGRSSISSSVSAVQTADDPLRREAIFVEKPESSLLNFSAPSRSSLAV